MSENTRPRVAIVDYGMGNLFSVMNACEAVGIGASITSSREEMNAADAVILPGVGAFGDAMRTLMDLDLVGPLREIAASEKPLVGICLGMQLMMTRSDEFGEHEGLNIIPGTVRRFVPSDGVRGMMKVPQVGWNRINHPLSPDGTRNGVDRWAGSFLAGVTEGEFMYFVHSYFVEPESSDVVLSTTDYEGVRFCSSLGRGNIFACQFHPERSGSRGLQVYRNLASFIKRSMERRTNG